MKRILFLLGLILFLNLSAIYSQEPELPEEPEDEMENENWKQSQVRLEEKMIRKENIPVEAEHFPEQEQLREKYRKDVLSKMNVQSHQSQIPKKKFFQSFLSMETERRWMAQDDPKKFFANTPFTRNLLSFPMIGRTAVKGWSGSYWPMRNGEISVRYNKNEKNTIGLVDPQTGNYLSYFIWAVSISMYSQPAEHKRYSASADFAKYVDENYSPAEKYDLLVGDENYTLTNFLKNEGKQYAYGNDMVQWFGICHGWAAASIYYNKPRTSVNLTSANGISIRFLPDDIKGLASLFWANAKYKTLFVGARCEYYYPHPGWFSSPNCLSLNPGSFFIILGNHVGLRAKNLIYEPSADPEIWNEPIQEYRMRYYNPLTNKFSANALTSRVPIADLRASTDSFLSNAARMADPKAAYGIGVMVKTTHTLFTQITDLVHDDHTAEDKTESKEYDAILFLDESMNIVGGEWKFKDHPNFIWHWDENEPIQGVSDNEFPVFAYTSNLVSLARKASNRGQPLKAIVDFLVQNAA